MIILKKNKLQQKIVIYTRRREKIRAKFGWRNGFPSPEGYDAAVMSINRMLKSWKEMLRCIKNKERKIEELRKNIIEWSGVDVKNSSRDIRRRIYISRSIFYRWGLENGIRGTHLSMFAGSPKTNRASINRMTFIRKCSKNKYYKDMWISWCNFMKDLKEIE